MLLRRSPQNPCSVGILAGADRARPASPRSSDSTEPTNRSSGKCMGERSLTCYAREFSSECDPTGNLITQTSPEPISESAINTGDREVFLLRASTHTLCPPSVEIGQDQLRLTYATES